MGQTLILILIIIVIIVFVFALPLLNGIGKYRIDNAPLNLSSLGKKSDSEEELGNDKESIAQTSSAETYTYQPLSTTGVTQMSHGYGNSTSSMTEKAKEAFEKARHVRLPSVTKNDIPLKFQSGLRSRGFRKPLARPQTLPNDFDASGKIDMNQFDYDLDELIKEEEEEDRKKDEQENKEIEKEREDVKEQEKLKTYLEELV